ncbi:TetR family transcriptional regulator [Glutamicibacter sp. PS]|uniref:TetR family transcriptional regulator n=1 Tax=Glutamicibacter sp. PS TaxID=3075634 RepID=UPI00283E28D6|nr:TetR family transcriptional regulator [Glutamicibacter sp. PS]MDR4531910.1 TetR/AcrR family transcriptional regulator [Glutamicibacter sp. PS]
MIASSAVPPAALDLLITQGFDATSVDELAAAAGISRSTFFRRFGSKENMVFADQEMIITHVQTTLAASSVSVTQTLLDAAHVVFDQYTANPEAARLRHKLLSSVAALRERELVSTHSYERAFNDFLKSRGLCETPANRSLCLGLSAGLVAIHNDHLRLWLRDAQATNRDRLAKDVRLFLDRFADLLEPDEAGAARGRSVNVVVSVLDPGADEQEVLAAVSEALRQSPA